MNDEQWLRDRLADALPTPPREGGRSRAAIARHRRTVRGRLIGSGLAAVVLLTAAGVPAGLALGHRGDDAGPASTTTALTCPADLTGDASGSPSLAPDPVAIKVCVAPRGTSAPLDLLTGSAAATIAAAIESGASYRGPGTCADDGPSGLVIAAVYADGTTRSLRVRDCPATSDGRGGTVGAVYRAVITAVQAQRADQTPPTTTPADPSCLMMPADPQLANPSGMVAGVLCGAVSGRAARSGDPSALSGVPIGAEDLATLVQDWASHRDSAHKAIRHKPCPGAVPIWVNGAGASTWHIEGVTAWGDAVEIQPNIDGQWMVSEGTTSWMTGCPGEASEKILNRLAGQLPSDAKTPPTAP